MLSCLYYDDIITDCMPLWPIIFYLYSILTHIWKIMMENIFIFIIH